ncbi:MAG TPA: 50S ribosomal protein L10 [Mycobacteriales bacterium]|nr:50S ribosomal protein L10 [Mycobacteriales bacterium]
MAKPEKVAAVAEISDRFRESSAAMLTEYRGLTMAQLTELRRSLGRETTYTVVKNTLTKRAVVQAGYAELEALLSGPTAIAFVTGDPVIAAKGLRDFARTNPMLVIKGAVMEGRALTADEVRQIADLQPREVLLAKLAGAMKAKTSQAAALFQAPLAQVARMAAALQEKLEKDAAGDAEAQPDTDPDAGTDAPED